MNVFVHTQTIKHAFLPIKSALLPGVITCQRSAQVLSMFFFLLLFIKTAFDKTLSFSSFYFLIGESRSLSLRTRWGLVYNCVSVSYYFCSSNFIHNVINFFFYFLTSTKYFNNNLWQTLAKIEHISKFKGYIYVFYMFNFWRL